ncbi:MAG: sensor domain-containing diguanylate cyclase [Pseudomonadota bacterium]
MAQPRTANAIAVDTAADDREWLDQLGNELVTDALGAREPLESLQRVTRALHRHFRLVVCGLFLVDETGSLQHDTHVGPTVMAYKVGQRWTYQHSIVARCHRTGEPQFVPNVLSDEDYIRTDAAVRTEFVIPLRFHGETLGVLNLEASNARTFSAPVRARLLKLADRIAGVIHLAVIGHRLNKTTQELAAANRRLTATARKLRRLATRDALTRIPNRRQFEESVTQALARQRRTGEDVSLMLIDVDRFKEFNDKYGHHRGDRVLARVARALKTALRRETDFVARYGGEEFAAIVNCDASGATVLADRICAAVRQVAIKHERSALGFVTISIGVAGAGPRATRDSLVQRADRALYLAKRGGRNCSRVSI